MNNTVFTKRFWGGKKFWGKKKPAKNKDEQSPLVERLPTQHTETLNDEEQESTADSEVPGSSAELSKIETLRMVLTDISNLQDPDRAPVIQENNLAQDWDSMCLQELDQFVEKHFPTLPEEATDEYTVHEFLQSTQRVIYSKVVPLIPQLESIGLRDPLIDSYSRHLFTKLNQLIQRNLSEQETLCLLLWGKDVFFRADSTLRVYDPLLLTGWFERAKHKLLQLLQNKISEFLQNILNLEENDGRPEESMNEEKFCSVHIDVIQCLNGSVEGAKKIGLTFSDAVKMLCSAELDGFILKYADAENKRLKKLKFTEKNSVYLFRIMNTCMQFRCPNQSIQNITKARKSRNDPDTEDHSKAMNMLQNLEKNTSSIIEMIMRSIAQDNLEIYFKENNGHMGHLMESIQEQCASLPQTATEIKRIAVKTAYNCVSKVYLECLMKTKFRKLEELWGNVEEKIKDDVQQFREQFSERNESAAQANPLLEKMTEVLWCRDVEALKITCAALLRDFPNESEQYMVGLLRWRGAFSKRQVQEVLETIQFPNTRCAFRCCFPY